jgi:hypothetical protein
MIWMQFVAQYALIVRWHIEGQHSQELLARLEVATQSFKADTSIEDGPCVFLRYIQKGVTELFENGFGRESQDCR